MKIQALALIPPTGAQEAPKVTPELLASSLAKYSRSNKGITSILEEIDWSNPDSAVDRIFKFVDYGHASIAGLTGSIPITIDGCSMFLAYKLFELIPLCDGQESSTRYIKMNESSILAPEVLGISDALREEWGSFMKLAFEVYQETYQELDKLATERPELIQYPEGVDEKVKNRFFDVFSGMSLLCTLPF